MKKATREFYAGMSIQQAYLQLVDEAISCNEHVYTEINGKKVSSKMSLDDVMKMFGGDGLEEYAKKLQETKEGYERRENEWKEKVEMETEEELYDVINETVMEKEFDIDAAKVGAKVTTRDGRSVKILYYDYKNDTFPIIALITDNGEEILQYYKKDGRWMLNDNEKSPWDLITFKDKAKK